MSITERHVSRKVSGNYISNEDKVVGGRLDNRCIFQRVNSQFPDYLCMCDFLPVLDHVCFTLA